MKLPDSELLRVLVAFQESKNLIEAAERLQVSQPAVSQRLQRLQDQVPVPLYDFVGRKKVLTNYGQGLYDLAKENLRQLELGFENLNRRYANASQLVLRLGGRGELFRFFSDLVRFSGKIELQQMEDSQALVALKADSIDVALTSTISGFSDFESRKIFESSSRIAFHRKLFESVESFRDLQGKKELILKTPSVAHRLQPSFFKDFCRGMKINGENLNTKAILEDWSSITAFIESGGGFSILPGFVQIQSKDVRFFEIPHAVIPRTSFFAISSRKLKKIGAFKEALNFGIWSS